MTKNFCLLLLIFQEPYIYDPHLWYTCMYKRIISPSILFIFFIEILISGIIRGWGVGNRQKMTQIDKNFTNSQKSLQLEEIPGLLTIKKVKLNQEKKLVRLMQVHGSMRTKDVVSKVEEIETKKIQENA